MKKAKTILNPLKPDITPSIYTENIGDVIQKFISEPGILASLFNTSLNDIDQIKQLEVVQLTKRTNEKPRWQGASGYYHQIDQSFSTEDEQVILLVECKSWNQPIDFPSLSAFLVRLIDISDKMETSTVLGMMVTPQGYPGRDGGLEEDRNNCIPNIRDYFNKKGYPIIIRILNHQVLSNNNK